MSGSEVGSGVRVRGPEVGSTGGGGPGVICVKDDRHKWFVIYLGLARREITQGG